MSGIRVGLNKGFPITKKENPVVSANKKVGGLGDNGVCDGGDKN